MRNRVRASWLSIMLMVTITFAGCYPFQGDVTLLLTPVPVDPTRQAEILQALEQARAEAAATPEPQGETAGEMLAVTATVSVNALRVRESADPDAPIVAGLRQDDSVTVVGRSEDGSWLQIEIPDVGGTGWVSAEFVTVDGDAMALPMTADGVAAAPESSGETAAPETGGEGEMMGMTLNVDPATLQIVDGTLTVGSLTSSTAGWLVVHADDGGTFGPVIGYAAVAEGENTDVVVPIDTEAATETVHLMLHEDGGVVGTYEFPGADAPVIMDGAPVSMAYAVGAPVTTAPATTAPATEGEATAEMPSISLADDADLQIVDGELTVPSITSSTAGWLVVHADNDGAPGPVIGYAAVAEGENSDVVIPIDTEAATETVHLMLHEDGGVMGTYEFPGADAPVMADGAPVMVAYAVGAPVVSAPATEGEAATSEGESEAAAEMPSISLADDADLQIVDGELTVPSITSSTAGWLVVHADNDGAPGPVIGYAAVAEGENSDVVIPIDTEAATETVHLMLHEDGGVMGTYEFPGADAPVMADGAPVMMAYNVGAPVTTAPAAGGETATTPVESTPAPTETASESAGMAAGEAAAATGQSSAELAQVNTRSLRVRSGPNADAEIVGGALNGDIYPVAEKSADGNWVRLYFPGTDGEAWVGSEFVEISSVGLNVKYGNVVVSTGGPRLRVRNAPSLDGEIVGHVYDGDIRYAIGVSTDGKWALLFLPAVPGPNWVSADYVSYQ